MNPPPSSPSNPFFLLPEQGHVNLGKKPGGGVFYARVSQTQTDVPGENGSRAFWRLEGFSQAWFDANNPPADEPTWRDPVEFSRYYSEAPIFLLELEVIPAHLDRFAPFVLINDFAEREAEPKEWFRVTAGGPRNGHSIQNVVPMTIFPSLYQEGIALTLGDIETVDEKTREQLDKAVSTGHIADAEDAEITRILGALSSRIDWSIVYDVGQGNSIGFCSPGEQCLAISISVVVWDRIAQPFPLGSQAFASLKIRPSFSPTGMRTTGPLRITLAAWEPCPKNGLCHAKHCPHHMSPFWRRLRVRAAECGSSLRALLVNGSGRFTWSYALDQEETTVGLP